MSGDTYALSGAVERLFSTRMVSPSETTLAMFSGMFAICASVDIFVLLMERLSMSGDGANLDMICHIGKDPYASTT